MTGLMLYLNKGSLLAFYEQLLSSVFICHIYPMMPGCYRLISYTVHSVAWRPVFLLCFLCNTALHGQDKRTTSKKDTAIKVMEIIVDTVVVDKNSYIVTEDSLIFTRKDTVIYVRDTIITEPEEISNPQEAQERERGFYQYIKRKLEKRRFTREIFNLVFDISTPHTKVVPQDTMAHIPKAYDGMIVGNISMKKIDVFGGSVTDTTVQADNRLIRFINDVHMDTRNRVILHNLLLEEGDIIDRYKILDNERVLRALPFIRDARVLVQPRPNDSDTVDLLVLTQDLLSVTGSLSPRGLSRANVHINDNNIMGTSNALQNEILIDPRFPQPLGYRGSYQLPNIRGSFVEANLDYQNTNFEHIYRFQLNRAFVVPSIKYAGGIEVSYNQRTTYAPDIDYTVFDTLTNKDFLLLMPYSYWYQDYWLARSFVAGERDQNNRARFTLALRYSQTNFDMRPAITADSNTAYHNYKLMLGKVGFSKRYYTTEELVYAYGRTEDIPIGYLLEFTAGPQLGEYYNRFYNGLSYSSGRFLNQWGYLSFLSELGGFWRHGNMEEGLLQVGVRSFSYLIHKKRTKLRFFVTANYTTGINRTQTINFQNEYLSIRNENGIRGLRSRDLFGNERLTLNLESVAYTPFNLYGFRFALFAFADIGWISQSRESVFSNNPYQGYGIGARIRNENLAFKTFQVRLSFYPIVPEGAQLIGFSISNVSLSRFLDFNSKKPDLFQFY